MKSAEFDLKKQARKNRLKYAMGLKMERRDLDLLSMFYFEFVKHPKINDEGEFIRPTDKEMIKFLRKFRNINKATE